MDDRMNVRSGLVLILARLIYVAADKAYIAERRLVRGPSRGVRIAYGSACAIEARFRRLAFSRRRSVAVASRSYDCARGTPKHDCGRRLQRSGTPVLGNLTDVTASSPHHDRVPLDEPNLHDRLRRSHFRQENA